LKEDQLKILKTMSEATGRMDINAFAKSLDFTPSQTIAQIQELSKEGFLHNSGHGYSFTTKGKNALKISAKVSDKTAFHFYEEMDKPLDISASSLVEFYIAIKQVCSESIDFHTNRGDFERWLSDALNDKELADDVAALKAKGFQGEKLRKLLLKAIDTKYGVGELL
jgi:hypothetical protein